MSYYFETLKLSTKKVKEDFESTKQIWHNPSAGVIREKVIKDIIKPYLPDCYGISSGLCFDKYENKSKQLDLVIYDKLYSYSLPFSKDFIIFPCESVYGNIEVKTKLDKKALQQSIENIASLKYLEREDATEFNFTPQLELRIDNEKLGKKKNTYFGIVIAYESISTKALLNYIKNSDYQKNEYLPGIFVLLDKNIIIFRANKISKTGIILELNGSSEGFIPMNTGDDTIAYFISYLMTILYHSHLKAMNPSNLFVENIMKERNCNISEYIQCK